MSPEPEVATLSSFDPLRVLGDRGSKRVRWALDAFMVGTVGYRTAKTAWGKFETKRTFRVTVESSDDLYPDVHTWLLDQLPEHRRKSLIARTRRGDELMLASPEGAEEPEPKLSLFYDGSIAHEVNLGGHLIKVWVDTERYSDYSRTVLRESIRFSGRGPEARDAVLAWLGEVALSKVRVALPRLYIATTWGDWMRQTDLPPRPLGSVVLAEGVVERLVGDLENFLDAEHAYVRLGLPWHRGYLLHGPAGTGKTSIARALAAHFGLDLYYLPLSDLTKDTNLLNLIGRLPARSALLLEDIDIVHAAKSRDDAESPGVSLSGLLNALDGMMTPHGLITMMTTNDRSVLDPALVRAGRADVDAEVGYLTRDQLLRLARVMLGPSIGLHSLRDVPLGREVSAAAVVGAVKEHLDDPDQALVAIEKVLS